jgi:hypothetical protein
MQGRVELWIRAVVDRSGGVVKRDDEVEYALERRLGQVKPC